MQPELILHEQTLAAPETRAKDERRSSRPKSSDGVLSKSRRSGRPRGKTVQGERLGALADMSAVIAHDLNNSLTPIIGFSDYMLDTAGGLPEEYRKCVQGIRKAAGDIAHMVEQMRQFYRRRDSNERLDSVDLNALIPDILESTLAQAPEFLKIDPNQIHVEVRLEKELPTVQDRASDIGEALRQVLLNALEAMPEGGDVLVHTQRLQEVSGDRILIEVVDTGIGMDSATQDRCLEPFFSTKGPRRRGLGLSLVYGVVRRHDGQIDLESKPGHGTRVRLILNPSSEPADSVVG